ncbi:hypothetical protein E4T47_03830 [Aureobasidium subglaciale]|nr:hypothetical protein E4T43_03965 [Aureobasidium subglaciale]KAI5273008.1 hypothetical protein E4T47_03830 [Aureobasidium subglaciale]
MAEPQPSQIQEGDQAPSAIPGVAKSETAALESLSSTNNSSSATTSTAALGKAMKNLDIKDTGKVDVKNIKVDMTDVVLLADNLDVSRARATELLKSNDADPVKAMRAWFTA